MSSKTKTVLLTGVAVVVLMLISAFSFSVLGSLFPAIAWLFKGMNIGVGVLIGLRISNIYDWAEDKVEAEVTKR